MGPKWAQNAIAVAVSTRQMTQKTMWESRSPGARTEQEWLSSSQIIGVGWGWNLSELTHLLGFLDRKRCNKSASYIINHNYTYIEHVGYYNLYNPKQTEVAYKVASPSPTHPTCNCAYKPLTDCIERPSSHLESQSSLCWGGFCWKPFNLHSSMFFFMRHIVIWTLHIYICHEGIRHVFKKTTMNIPLIDDFP